MIILTQEILQQVTDNHAFIVLIRSIAMRANNNQTCFPSINKICEDTDLSKPTVIKALNYLVEKQVINRKKIVRKDGGFSSSFYTICTENIKVAKAVKLQDHEDEIAVKEIYPLVKEIDKGSQGDLPPLVNDVYSNSQEQIELTRKDNSIKKEIKKVVQKFDAEEYLKSLEINLEVKNSLLDLVEVRKCKKTPTTQKAIDLIVKDLESWHIGDIDKQKRAIEKSIKNGWTGVFEYQEPQNFNQKPKDKSTKSAWVQPENPQPKIHYDVF